MALPASSTAAATRLRQSLGILSRLNFMFSGLLLIAGLQLSSACLFALAGLFYEAAAVETLLIATFVLGAPMRRKLGKFYTVSLFVPDLGLLWALVEHLRGPVVPPGDWIVIGGLCAAGLNLTEAFTMAKFRQKGSPLDAAVTPLLRSTLPFSIAVVAAGIVTMVSDSSWGELIVGYGIAAWRFRSSNLLGQIADLDLTAGAAGRAGLEEVATRHPRLALLLSPDWKAATATPEAESDKLRPK